MNKEIGNILKKSSELYLSSKVTSVSHKILSEYIWHNDSLYIFINRDSITAAQLKFNPAVTIELADSDSGKLLTISGKMKPVTDSGEVTVISEKWKERYPATELMENDGLYTIRLNEIYLRDADTNEEIEKMHVTEKRENFITGIVSNVINKFKLLVAIIRAPFFSASILSVVLGASIAYNHNFVIRWSALFLTLIGAILAQAAANVINDFFDHRSGNDEINKNYTIFSGGSRMIQNKIITPEATWRIALFLFLMTIIIGLYLNYQSTGNVVLIIGVIGVFLAFTYSASPLKLAYRGIGEFAIVASFGPLIVMGTYYVQTQRLDSIPLLASIPNGILVGLILFINEFQDMQADGEVGKNTIVVKGKTKKRALLIYKASVILVFVWLVCFTLLRLFPIWTFLTLLALPMVIKAFKVVSENYDKINELVPANALTIGLHLVVTLLFSLAFIL